MSASAAAASPATADRARSIDRATYRRLAGRVKLLSWVSLAYMTVEGGIAMLAGVLAGSVALQFFVLAPYVGFESVQALVDGERPDVSWLGIALCATSLVVMPYLGIAKQRIADQIGSAATKGEGRQNMLCAYLAGALLLGLLGNAALGAWWLDPLVGMLIAVVAVKEGAEAWRGEGCACSSDPLAGLGETAGTCADSSAKD